MIQKLILFLIDILIIMLCNSSYIYLCMLAHSHITSLLAYTFIESKLACFVSYWGTHLAFLLNSKFKLLRKG